MRKGAGAAASIAAGPEPLLSNARSGGVPWTPPLLQHQGRLSVCKQCLELLFQERRYLK
jgi:hypothetical protein